MKRAGFVAAIAILALTLQMVAFAGVQQVWAQDDALEPVRVMVLPFTSYAPFYIGVEAGYFEDEGLDVELIVVRSGSEAVPAIVQGDVDVTADFMNASLFNAIARGANVRAVADKGTISADDACSYITVLVRDELVESGEVDELEDIGGFITSVNDTSIYGYLLDRVLSDAGIALTDVENQYLNAPLIFEAMQEGSIDTTVVSDPWALRMIDEGFANALLEVEDTLVEPFTFSFILFGEDLLTEREEVAMRFMSGWLRAVEQYNEGPTEENLDILEEALQLDREELSRMCFPPINGDGVINVDSIMDYEAWAIERGLIDEQIAIEAIVDTRFIEAIAAEANEAE